PLPTMCSYREYVAAGCFMSYGPFFGDLFRRTAEHVSKILRGAKPADIPVEQPTKFELVINMKTAVASPVMWKKRSGAFFRLEVHDQPAALAGGHRRNAPWTNVSRSRPRRTNRSESRWVR